MTSRREHLRAEGDALPAMAAGASRNRLLCALPVDEYARLIPALQPVTLETMQLLAEAGAPLRQVYFPETGVISIMRRMRDGTLVEAGLLGCEGVAGVEALLDDAWSPSALVASVPGEGWSLPLETLRRLLPTLPALRVLLHRVTLSLLDQVGQVVACNSLHSVEQRCARWLLMACDRAGGDEILLTHEVLARMLAVRRAGVTEAALTLQRARVITYRRGRIVVQDRPGLEAAACECYGVVRRHAERLLGHPGGETS